MGFVKYDNPFRLSQEFTPKGDQARAIGELCEAGLAKQPTISKLIDRLVQQGMVARRSDPADARRVLLSLTASGHATMAPVLQDASAFNLSLLADYPPEQLTALKQLLRDMIARYGE